MFFKGAVRTRVSFRVGLTVTLVSFCGGRVGFRWGWGGDGNMRIQKKNYKKKKKGGEDKKYNTAHNNTT